MSNCTDPEEICIPVSKTTLGEGLVGLWTIDGSGRTVYWLRVPGRPQCRGVTYPPHELDGRLPADVQSRLDEVTRRTAAPNRCGRPTADGNKCGNRTHGGPCHRHRRTS